MTASCIGSGSRRMRCRRRSVRGLPLPATTPAMEMRLAYRRAAAEHGEIKRWISFTRTRRPKRALRQLIESPMVVDD